MQRYFIHLAYNGIRYHGWQIQPNAVTVQQVLNEKISLLTGENVNLVGCGRTDTGVHARMFFAHFDLENEIKMSPEDFVHRLNGFHLKDIVVYNLWPVPDEYHARFSATSRTYKYYITKIRDPFAADLSWEYSSPLDIIAMQKATQYLFDYTDFTSFSKLHTQTATNDCKIIVANWEESDNQMIFTITADRFLRNMVRAIVGTLVEIGKGKLVPEDMKCIIESKDRGEAGFSVPACGLFLEKIAYPFALEGFELMKV
ncbi:MAG: tRNA pseudouridine(38-40) synthase TruA [Bacteroidales bacterium]|nr:tRNA pseudouridine(38-40) synthase TruA [Bacteroidales bacterium]